MTTRFTRPHYAWFVAAVAFVLLLFSAGLRSTPTMFIRPLEFEFGWSDATISAAIAVNIALFGLMGPFAAALMERFGVRRVILAALVLLAGSIFASTRVTQAWQLILDWGVLVGAGTGCISLVLSATIATRWFAEKRGLVMGLLTASNATGQLVFLPLFGFLVAGPGWRACSYVLAGVCVLLLPLVALVVRDRPSDVGLPPYGATEIETVSQTRRNPLAIAYGSLREASRSRDFWLLAGTFAICGASTNGLIGAHLVPACGDHGIPEVKAAGLLAMMGVFDLIGTTASGWLSDRFNARYLLFAYYAFRGVSLLFLPQAFGLGVFGLPAFAVFYGLDWIATVPPTVRLASDVFGKEKAPIVFGWISASHQLGAGIVAYTAGAIRTNTGSYDSAFELSGVLCMIAALLALGINVHFGRRPRLAASEA